VALTQDQAKQAGQIAVQMDILNAAIGAVQAALSANMTLTSQGATAITAGAEQQAQLSCSFQLNVADSATVLNALLSVYQSNLTTLTNQLSGM
jgi:hypothetical protein